MSIKITCLQCGKSHKVNNRLAGKRVRCPECDTAVHVPELPVSENPRPTKKLGDGEKSKASQPAAAEPVEVIAGEAIGDQSATGELIAEAVVDDSAAAGQSAAGQSVAGRAVAGTDAAGKDGLGKSAPGGLTTELGKVGDKGGPAVPPTLDDDDDDEIAPRSERDLGELDMTPMVDVTFLLLIFFVVTASFQLQKSIMMPRQQTDAPSTNSVDDPPDELDQVELQIDEFGAFTVLASDWEAETPGKQNLISKLREAQPEAGAKLIIKVHEQCMLQALVDGMDAGTIADYKEIEVTQVDEFD